MCADVNYNPILDTENAMKCGDIFISNVGNFVFCCYLCDEKFANIKSFIQHFEEKHSAAFSESETKVKEQPLIETNNEICVKFDDYYIDKKEMETIDDETEHELQNTTISDDFNTSYQTNHERNKDATDSLENPESISEVQVLQENPAKTSMNSRPLTCKYCGKHFPVFLKLQQHESTHTQKMPFVCKICSTPFRLQIYLTRHLVVHSEVRPHACPHCDATFKLKSDMMHHQRRRHEEYSLQHKCEICKSAFHTIKEKNSHMRRHDKKTLLMCSKCDKVFNSKSELKKHKRDEHKSEKHVAKGE